MNKEFSEKKARDLTALFHCGSNDRIEKFFREHEKYLLNILDETNHYEKLFSPGFIEYCDFRYVRILCEFLSGCSVFSRICYPALIIQSDEVDPRKKALFWHILSEISIDQMAVREIYTWIVNEFSTYDVFMDNIQARQKLCHFLKRDARFDFIRSTSSGVKNERFGRQRDARLMPINGLEEAVKNDQVSFFEISRQLFGKKITTTMLLYLLNHNAVKCFNYLLAHFPQQVYKCRTPEEWLFTVCRCYPAEIAIPIIREIEKDHPGIVENARDPWKNTLLWNTFVNQNHSIDRIQGILLTLGCDPLARNQWGLSFQIIKENTL